VNTDLLLRIGAHRGLLPCRPGVHRALRGLSDSSSPARRQGRVV
jgi:hypothetical protein